MDPQNQQPATPKQQSELHPPALATPATTVTSNATQVDKAKLAISDKEAQALLAINNLQQPPRKHGNGPSLGIMISVAVLVILVILASYALSSLKSDGSLKSSNGSANSATSATKSPSSQVSQDVHTCTNPVKAMAEC